MEDDNTITSADKAVFAIIHIQVIGTLTQQGKIHWDNTAVSQSGETISSVESSVSAIHFYTQTCIEVTVHFQTEVSSVRIWKN